MDWFEIALKLVDGSTAAVLVLFMIWALFSDKAFLKREMDTSETRRLEAEDREKTEREARKNAEHVAYELTTELRESNKTQNKIIDLLLERKGEHGES